MFWPLCYIKVFKRFFKRGKHLFINNCQHSIPLLWTNVHNLQVWNEQPMCSHSVCLCVCGCVRACAHAVFSCRNTQVNSATCASFSTLHQQLQQVFVIWKMQTQLHDPSLEVDNGTHNICRCTVKRLDVNCALGNTGTMVVRKLHVEYLWPLYALAKGTLKSFF